MGLDLIDSLDETTSLDDDSMTRKPRSCLRGCQLRTLHLPRMEGQLRWHHFRARDKESAETVRKASMGTLSADDLRNLSGGRAANCESPTPVANVDMMSFNKDMTKQMDPRSTAKENLRREWLALKAKQLEIKK